MTTPAPIPLDSLGLGGDGDEIDAIAEVEQSFGVRLEYSTAHSWYTVGDVFAALQRALPADDRHAEDRWHRFTQAICQETGAAPDRVRPATLLLARPLLRWPPRQG